MRRDEKEESQISQQRLTIKDWPLQDKPRERLFLKGASALSDAELIAILLGTGTANETVMELSQRMLSLSEERYGTSLGFLNGVTPLELDEVSGIGPAKVARLKAGVELGRRLYGPPASGKRTVVRSGRDVYEYIKADLEGLDREHFMVILLNARNQVIGKEVVSVGSLDASIVHPREVFRDSIRRNAKSIVLAHNHPSGDPTPSDEDIEVTGRLREAGTVLGISVVDHVVVGRSSYVSLRDTCPAWFTI